MKFDFPIELKMTRWEIKFCKNVGPCDTIYTEYGANDVCLPRIVGIGNTRLHVKRFGDADQIEKRITFFDQPYFGGLSFFVDKVGANFTLPSPIRSYFFTGVNTWEHKTAKDAPDGNCVRYAPSVGEKGYGFTLEASVHHVVGAVKYGCTGETVPTTRTTVTPTSTTSSGTMSRFDYWFSTNLIFALVYRFRLR